MIPYEELCEALEHNKRRQQNQAELDQLDKAPATEIIPAKSSAAKGGGFGAEVPEDTHEIDVEQMVVDEPK